MGIPVNKNSSVVVLLIQREMSDIQIYSKLTADLYSIPECSIKARISRLREFFYYFCFSLSIIILTIVGCYYFRLNAAEVSNYLHQRLCNGCAELYQRTGLGVGVCTYPRSQIPDPRSQIGVIIGALQA